MHYIDTRKIPESSIVSLLMYLTEGCETGGFLQRVISNDLVGSVGYADGQNVKLMPEYASFMSNSMPTASWGSTVALQTWLGRRGFNLSDKSDADRLAIAKNIVRLFGVSGWGDLAADWLKRYCEVDVIGGPK